MNFYMPIEKVDKAEDGTLTVFGIASSEAIDTDGEMIKSDAMRDALPDFFKYGTGNLREMHQPLAAGTIDKAEVDGDGYTYIEAHVVDPVAVKKVEAGVYKGFSIGGKVTSRDKINKAIITGLKLVEVSLVDRPANPEAVFTMYKSEDMEEAEVKAEVSAKKAEVKAEVSAPAEILRKGMYGVSELASILASLSWITSDAEWESQMEGDASPIPQALREWLQEGCSILAGMVAEETAEMIASLQSMVPTPEPEPMQMAEGSGDLEKKGATLSTATKEKLSVIKETIQAAMGYLDELMTVKDSTDDDKENADAVADLQKSAQVSADALLKVEGENAALKKRVAALEAVPAPSKVITKTTVVSKDEDAKAEALTKAEAEEFEKMSPEQKAESMLKKMFKRQTRT